MIGISPSSLRTALIHTWYSPEFGTVCFILWRLKDVDKWINELINDFYPALTWIHFFLSAKYQENLNLNGWRPRGKFFLSHFTLYTHVCICITSYIICLWATGLMSNFKKLSKYGAWNKTAMCWFLPEVKIKFYWIISFLCKIFCYTWFCLVVLLVTHILQRNLGRMLPAYVEKIVNKYKCWFVSTVLIHGSPTELKHTALPGHAKARSASDL